MSLKQSISRSRNCLFLICPTDHIEGVVTQIYGEKAYFYTALGANFCWDVRTQKSILELIENRNIEQIVFLTKCSNLFYKKVTVPEQKLQLSYPIGQTLQKLDKTLPHGFLSQSHFIMRIMLLASRHLQEQHRHILKTSILGRSLKKKFVSINEFVYYSETGIFYSPQSIEKQILLHSTQSLN